MAAVANNPWTSPRREGDMRLWIEHLLEDERSPAAALVRFAADLGVRNRPLS